MDLRDSVPFRMNVPVRAPFSSASAPNPVSSPETSKPSKVGPALIGLGILLGGGLLIGGFVVLSRGGSPLSAHTVTLHKAISLIGGGTLALGGLTLTGILLMKKDRGTTTSRAEMSESPVDTVKSALTITPEMIRNQDRSEQARMLSEILAKHPNLKELKFSEEFLIITGEMINSLPLSLEELEVCIESDQMIDITINRIATRLPSLRELTVKIAASEMTGSNVSAVLSMQGVVSHLNLRHLFLHCDERVSNNVNLDDSLQQGYFITHVNDGNSYSCSITKRRI